MIRSSSNKSNYLNYTNVNPFTISSFDLCLLSSLGNIDLATLAKLPGNTKAVS